ncbi:MAG: hypothetical protein QNK05_13950 [Myxococcota bacterium]|nr:hypothetical protein [Myxococcota bacterium]
MARLTIARTILLCLALGASGCAALYEEVITARVALDDYDDVYPIHVGICAVSQFRRIDGRVGGSPGHAAMFIQGACVDETASYPLLRRCREDDPEKGTGISVNKWLRNVNWIATPGHDLFFNGEVSRTDILTRETVDETARRALELGVLKGVELHDGPDGPWDRFEFMRDEVVGTDLALRFGRSLFCTAMPVTEAMLDDVIGFLNELNVDYADGETDYRWSGYADNCVHTVRNALAAADVWKPKSIRSTRLRQLFNLAVPANEMVNLGWLGARESLTPFSSIYRDPVKRRSLLERDWLPTRHGVLVQAAPAHQRNEVFDHRFRLFWNPLDFGFEDRAGRLLNDARFTEVDLNLFHWRARYRLLLDRRPDPDRRTLRSRAYLEAEQRYYDYLETQLADTQRLIEQLLSKGEEGSD